MMVPLRHASAGLRSEHSAVPHTPSNDERDAANDNDGREEAA